MMSIGRLILITIVVLGGAAGAYWMLPAARLGLRPPRAYKQGALLATCALGLLIVAFLSPPGPWLPTVFFYIFSVAAIAGALLTVTSRNPVYSALWFASVVLSTAGLFLLAGAPFLAAGTVIVYAGAIIVTFLFVIMLAQMEGKALYDRSARSPGAATFACFVLLWSLAYSLLAVKAQTGGTVEANRAPTPEKALPRGRDIHLALEADRAAAGTAVAKEALSPWSMTLDGKGAAKPNVAGLGESLYTDHLVSAGLAGVLLFVALVGAVAITNPPRSNQEPPSDGPRRSSS
jgi:NADH-quinone oxidoreductase subunit J